jgi:hypothetical protein
MFNSSHAFFAFEQPMVEIWTQITSTLNMHHKGFSFQT